MVRENKMKVVIYDTTLRDGAQGTNLSLSIDDKVQITRELDKLGVPFIEGGMPGATTKDLEFFKRFIHEPLSQAELVAFCSTHNAKNTVDQDPMLQSTLEAGTLWVAIFGKSWPLNIKDALKIDLDKNLCMIRDSVQFLRKHERRVIYDAEHFFDGYKADKKYALKTLEVALKAGAEWLVLCDTNGGTFPHEITQITREVISSIDTVVRDNSFFQNKLFNLGIHAHNDSELAVANSIAAVLGGVKMVQGTINGYGERCGNANLCSLIPNLQIKLGFDCIHQTQLSHLTAVSRLISEVVNVVPADNAPFVGCVAFAHKAGMHVAAVEQNPVTYEHINPELVGNQRRIVVSDQSGASNIIAKARSFGINLDKSDPICKAILSQLKSLENEGYRFEGADASFELLIRSMTGRYTKFFELKSWSVACDLIQEMNPLYRKSQATVKILVNGNEILTVAEQEGPVLALDTALRKALVEFYPVVQYFRLTDYKVRVLDGNSGTSAKTRVLANFSDGYKKWTTVGVSINILEASYQALFEGIEYGLLLPSLEKDMTSTTFPLSNMSQGVKTIFHSVT